jgi:hypothetical protein
MSAMGLKMYEKAVSALVTSATDSATWTRVAEGRKEINQGMSLKQERARGVGQVTGLR